MVLAFPDAARNETAEASPVLLLTGDEEQGRWYVDEDAFDIRLALEIARTTGGRPD